MGNYDDIGLAIPGQPISSGQFGTKVRNAIVDLDARLSIREAAEELPASLKAWTNTNANTLVSAANTWANLPTNLTLQITNPSPVFDLVCMVFFGAWMQTSAGDVRMGINVTGGVTSDPDPSDNSPVGYGLMPLTSSPTAVQHNGVFELRIPAGAATVTLTAQGRRSNGTATAAVNYPSINVVPIRYAIPA